MRRSQVSCILFISDLHLAPERPRIVEAFIRFLETACRSAESLYILGDLFDYWAGDDESEAPFNRSIADALALLARTGVRVHLMHGNRDLLIGTEFAQRCAAELVADPTRLDLYGVNTLLMHGDTLCTDDVDYQAFRRFAHDPRHQRDFLAQPLAARRRQLVEWRSRSEVSKTQKSAEIMDVTVAAVEEVLRRNDYPRLIHGHTHRPARHLHTVDQRVCERWVLPDWYERGGYLRCDREGCTALGL